MRRVAPFLAVVLAVGLLNQSVDGRFYVRVLTLTIVWALGGVAWNVMAKAGQISLGHSAFVGIGAYTFTIMLRGDGQTSVWVGMIVGMGLAATLALVVGLPTFRLRGFYFTLATLAFPLILELLVSNDGSPELTVPYHPEAQWRYMEFSDPHIYVWVGLAMLVVALTISVLIDVTSFGFALRSIRDNEVLARAIGIRSVAWKAAAFMISAALSAAMAVLWVKAVLHVTVAEETFSINVVIIMMSVAFVGGIGRTWGPVVGAGVLIPLAMFLDKSVGDKVPGAQELVYGGALILVALLIPDGVIPAAQRLLNVVKKPAPRRSTLIGFVHMRRRQRPTAEAGVPVLQIESVAKSFGANHVLSDVSFTVGAGEKVGVIGPNGAGKTTLFNILTAHLRADAGQILFKGVKIDKMHAPHRYELGMSRTFQVPQGFEQMSPLDNVTVAAIGAAVPRPMDASMRILERVGLGGKALGELNSLTVAEMKILELARAMVSEPELLLLDEPLAGLNESERLKFFELVDDLAEDTTSILVIEHSVRSLIQYVDSVVAFDGGRIIAAGRPDDVVSNPQVIEAYLGSKWVANAKNP